MSDTEDASEPKPQFGLAQRVGKSHRALIVFVA